MKISTACVLGMIGSILFCIKSVIALIVVVSYLDPISIFTYLIPVAGWILMAIFFAVLKQKSKKIDIILRDL